MAFGLLSGSLAGHVHWLDPLGFVFCVKGMQEISLRFAARQAVTFPRLRMNKLLMVPKTNFVEKLIVSVSRKFSVFSHLV